MGTVAYQDRGGRCEGLFRQPVAASAKLAVVGLHRHPPKFTPGAGGALQVTAQSRGASATVMLRVLSTRQRHYYRMDAVIDPKTRYVWPRDVLDSPQVRLTPNDLKAIACEGSCDRNEPRLIPVSITDGPTVPSSGVSVWLRAALDLQQLFVLIERDGDKAQVLPNEEILAGQVLPAGAPKEVFVPLGPGIYRLRATGVPVGQSAVDETKAVILVP